jgi:hypothetical protein
MSPQFSGWRRSLVGCSIPVMSFQIDAVEMVQRRAARFVTGQYNRYQSVTSMLQELKWTSLQQTTRTAIGRPLQMRKQHRPVTKRAALRWTISTASIWYWRKGSHTDDPYSKFGRTSVVYAFSLTSLLHLLRFLLRNAKMPFALVVVWSWIWKRHQTATGRS